jgi:hypothetical protein
VPTIRSGPRSKPRPNRGLVERLAAGLLYKAVQDNTRAGMIDVILTPKTGGTAQSPRSMTIDRCPISIELGHDQGAELRWLR